MSMKELVERFDKLQKKASKVDTLLTEKRKEAQLKKRKLKNLEKEIKRKMAYAIGKKVLNLKNPSPEIVKIIEEVKKQ